MQANELMIGDIVLIHGFARKVCAITRRSVGYHLYGKETIMHYAKLNEVSPIPLSKEFLEINGFKYKTTDWEVVYEGKSYGNFGTKTLYVLIDKESFNLASYYGYSGHGDIDAHVFASIHYGHELQHAMRLIGMNELADDFFAL